MANAAVTTPGKLTPVNPHPAPQVAIDEDPDKQGSPGLRPGDPPFNMRRMERWVDNPRDAELERLAKEFLKRCGEVVIVTKETIEDENGEEKVKETGILYSLEETKTKNPDGSWSKTSKIVAIPREFLGMKRQQIATGIDQLKLDRDPNA